jgi:hypothetical protein
MPQEKTFEELRIETIVNLIKDTLVDLEILQSSSGNMSYDQDQRLKKIITNLKKIQ